MSRQYITTAIDYPNAPPHMGHVLEKVLADVCARWMRLRGDDIRFQIGTDEHGTKIQRTAEKEGISPRKLVDRNVPLYQDLYKRLNISSDYFIRTTNKKVHWPTVVELWKRLDKAGMLEKRSYTGKYCSGCERFMAKRDLVDGKCPNHLVEPEEVTEENWFFLLSKEGEWLKDLLTKGIGNGGYKIVPKFREKETLSLIGQGLEDVSFSRPKSSLSWGVPVPGDEEQTMYVWCDALTNYISSLGLLTDKEDQKWWNDAEVTHVIGKDIARFHALIWPAMLKHAGVRTPDRLLIHGFLTCEGDKMSKTTGNVVAPDDVLKKFNGNPDPLRFYLSHEVPVGRDGDFSWDRIEKLYDSKLRNQLGNLLNRVLVLMKKIGSDFDNSIYEEVDYDPAEQKFVPEIDEAWNYYSLHMNNFKIELSLNAVMNLVSKLNRRIDSEKPWSIDDIDLRRYELSAIAEYLRHVSLMLLPFTPGTSERMLKQLGLEAPETIEGKTHWGAEKGWKKIGEPEILFEPLQ